MIPQLPKNPKSENEVNWALHSHFHDETKLQHHLCILRKCKTLPLCPFNINCHLSPVWYFTTAFTNIINHCHFHSQHPLLFSATTFPFTLYLYSNYFHCQFTQFTTTLTFNFHCWDHLQGAWTLSDHFCRLPQCPRCFLLSLGSNHLDNARISIIMIMMVIIVSSEGIKKHKAHQETDLKSIEMSAHWLWSDKFSQFPALLRTNQPKRWNWTAAALRPRSIWL